MVAAARADPRAFAALYERYVGPIYRYCHVRTGSREAAEDATSEVFLRALAALDGYRDGSFVAWLFRIAHMSAGWWLTWGRWSRYAERGGSWARPWRYARGWDDVRHLSRHE